jgi:hypothetical protein
LNFLSDFSTFELLFFSLSKFRELNTENDIAKDANTMPMIESVEFIDVAALKFIRTTPRGLLDSNLHIVRNDEEVPASGNIGMPSDAIDDFLR